MPSACTTSYTGVVRQRWLFANSSAAEKAARAPEVPHLLALPEVAPQVANSVVLPHCGLPATEWQSTVLPGQLLTVAEPQGHAGLMCMD